LEKLNFFKRVRRLSFIDRCSNIPHIRPYPVSDHSFYIALYAMVFADLENERIRENLAREKQLPLCGELYEISEVIKKALIHDLEESETGDILYPLHNEFSEFKKDLDIVREKCVDLKLFSELPLLMRKRYIKLWKNSKDNSKEGQLVACMDKFEILMFAINELDMGNLAVKELYDNAIHIILKKFNIPSVLELVDEIRIQYE